MIQTSANRINKMVEWEKKFNALANGKPQKKSNDFRDKCKGAIMGLAVADALGSVIEFAPKLEHRWIDSMEECKVWHNPKGYITDDTSMALNIMQGFLDDTEHYHVRNVAKAFVKWMDEGQWSATGHCFDIGTSCSAGLNAFKRTGSLVNGTPFSRGCGGVMRFAPSWLIEYKVSGDGNMNRRLGAMLDINNIDHYNEECIGAIAILSNIFNSHLLDNVRTDETSIYSSWLEASGGFDAQGCLETALWAFNHTKNFRDAIVACINIGGDADSCGAVCGQIAGSYYGYDAIPKDWLLDLHDRDKIESFTEKFLDETIQ